MDAWIRPKKSKAMPCWNVFLEEMRNSYKILVGEHGKKTLGRPRRRWEYNIGMDLRVGGCGTEFIWLWIGTSGGLLWTQ
jgi:hypothetical protein